MKIKVLFGVSLGGGVDAHPEDVVEVPDYQGRRLIHRGKAVLAEKETATSEKKGKS